jgi:hypothetical protein
MCECRVIEGTFAGLWESFRWPDEAVRPQLHHPDHRAERRDGGTARPHAGGPRTAGLAGLAW